MRRCGALDMLREFNDKIFKIESSNAMTYRRFYASDRIESTIVLTLKMKTESDFQGCVGKRNSFYHQFESQRSRAIATKKCKTNDDDWSMLKGILFYSIDDDSPKPQVFYKFIEICSPMNNSTYVISFERTFQ